MKGIIKKIKNKIKKWLLDAKLYGLVFDFCAAFSLLLCGSLILSKTIKHEGLGAFLVVSGILCLIARFFYMADLLWARDYHPLIPRLEIARTRLLQEIEESSKEGTDTNNTDMNQSESDSTDVSLNIEMER